MQKSIEFQLHHWEISQLSPYYYVRGDVGWQGERGSTNWKFWVTSFMDGSKGKKACIEALKGEYEYLMISEAKGPC